jgi:type IV pilus assembly protein PilB
LNKENEISIATEILQLIDAQFANQYHVIPYKSTNTLLSFYTPEDYKIKIEELEIFFGKKIELYHLKKEVFDKALSKYYRIIPGAKTFNINEGDFLERIINEAKSLECSDIHFESFDKNSRIRFRVDGILTEKYIVNKREYQEIVNKIKIKANLDITEKRLPQDGRIKYNNFDIRTSILPTLHGEKIVLRILGKDTTYLSLDKLGFNDAEKNIYRESIKKANGIILISGPTGSGKTTTLYATLKELNDVKRNILTIEDPIEYTLEGINQVQLKEDIGLSFTTALRSFLRQDPDIIMLGEIRDVETAKMAIRASLTGHLVLSTIHTNSALGTISRLIDMDIPPFLIAETLNVSVAQRLVRKLCNHCKSVEEIPSEYYTQISLLPNSITHHAVAVGCEKCHYTGYVGRTAIYEVLPISVEIATLIKNQAKQISQKDIESKYMSLSEKALELLKDKITSIEELYSYFISN